MTLASYFCSFYLQFPLEASTGNYVCSSEIAIIYDTAQFKIDASVQCTRK